MPPRRVNAFRGPLDAIVRLLKQSSLFSFCGLVPKRGCQHARNCADADRRQSGQESLGVIFRRRNLKRFVYCGVIPIATVISSFAWM